MKNIQFEYRKDTGKNVEKEFGALMLNFAELVQDGKDDTPELDQIDYVKWLENALEKSNFRTCGSCKFFNGRSIPQNCKLSKATKSFYTCDKYQLNEK